MYRRVVEYVGVFLIFKIIVFFGEERNINPRRKTFPSLNLRENGAAAGFQQEKTQRPLHISGSCVLCVEIQWSARFTHQLYDSFSAKSCLSRFTNYYVSYTFPDS